jgi:hypothetical protein
MNADRNMDGEFMKPRGNGKGVQPDHSHSWFPGFLINFSSSIVFLVCILSQQIVSFKQQQLLFEKEAQMKAILTLLGWGICTAVILYAVANPQTGILFENPSSVIGVSLIGLGLCKMAHERRAAENASRE